jgi:phospholipid/cholesterol/gamma-HCH transport system permease protein
MQAFVQAFGSPVVNAITGFGAMLRFYWQMLVGFLSALLRPRLIVNQLFAVGVRTLLIILVSGLFVGMVLGLQFYTNLVDFGAESQLGLLVALTLVRELGPVLTALLFAGRACSALTAEIGLMKTTEQLAAMEMMAVDPFQRVILPRYIAGIISLPLLAAIFTAVGIYGGYIVGVAALGLDEGVYWSAMSGIDFYDDVVNGLIKAVVFGLVINWIAVYQGYNAVATSEGVSQATTRTVVTSSLSVLALDFVLTSIMFS